jgi:hypothetical protein
MDALGKFDKFGDRIGVIGNMNDLGDGGQRKESWSTQAGTTRRSAAGALVIGWWGR